MIMMISKEALERSPQIERLIQLMLKEAEDFGHNKRASYRDALVCPIAVRLPHDEGRFKAFSKNISASGICIIGEKEVRPEKIATLEIYRFDTVATALRARCIWSREFHGFFMSGWKFMRVHHQLNESLK